jgi:ribonuclease P protein component
MVLEKECLAALVKRLLKKEEPRVENVWLGKFMLAKKNRLTHDKDFKRVTKMGKVINQPLLFIKVLPNDLVYSRFGIVVSNKVSKKATLRNRLKRQLRALSYSALKELSSSFDIVILVRPEARQKKFQELKEIFLSAMRKLNKNKPCILK